MKLRRHHIPFISGIFHRLNEDIRIKGVQKAFKDVLDNQNIPLLVNCLDHKLIKILKSHRVILVANHPNEIEPFVLLASLPSRSSVFVLVNILFLNWLSELNKHLIPVHVRHRLGKSERFRLRARLFWLLPLANRNISYEKGHAENILSINKASQKLDTGGMVIIFPE
jgi:1-acyl-sn-glycerol-3-phosphate acyltransferase